MPPIYSILGCERAWSCNATPGFARNAACEQSSPVVSLHGSRLVVAAEQVAVLGAAKSLPVAGERLGICVAFGSTLDTATCYDLSIPTARKLVSCVLAALADPPPPREP